MSLDRSKYRVCAESDTYTDILMLVCDIPFVGIAIMLFMTAICDFMLFIIDISETLTPVLRYNIVTIPAIVLYYILVYPYINTHIDEYFRPVREFTMHMIFYAYILWLISYLPICIIAAPCVLVILLLTYWWITNKI